MNPTPKSPTASKPTVIAIDGGSASGKSTTSSAVAKALGYLHVDSGALYRAVSWKVLAARVNPDDSVAVKHLLPQITLQVEASHERTRIRINGAEVADAALRTPEVTSAVSAVSAIPEVRALVNSLLRALAEKQSVVVEGRDIGTVVFPNAPHKFFLKASPEMRAQRRKMDLEKLFGQPASADSPPNNFSTDVAQVQRELTTRDHKDSSRAVDPLRQAEDAMLVDTTLHTVEETAAIILQHIRRNPATPDAAKSV